MKRKIFEKMLKWKEDSAGKTALLIDGARRVGKSYIAKEFAKEHSYFQIWTTWIMKVSITREEKQIPM